MSEKGVLRSLLVPNPPRDYRGRRWISIGLRTAHIACFSVLVGGVVLGCDPEQTSKWLMFAMITGTSLVVLELHRSLVWLRQLRGLAIMLKLAMLGIAFHEPHWTPAMLFAVIVLSSVVSHMPGRYRYRVVGARHSE